MWKLSILLIQGCVAGDLHEHCVNCKRYCRPLYKHKPLKDIWQAMCINLNVNLWWGTHHISFMLYLLSSTVQILDFFTIIIRRTCTSFQVYSINKKPFKKIKIKNKKTRALENIDHFSYIAHDSQIPWYTSYCFIGNFIVIFIPLVLTLVRTGKK